MNYTRTSLDYQSIEITSLFAVIPNCSVISDCLQFNIRWVPDNNAESTLLYDPIKLRKPVEWLVALAPLVVRLCLAWFNVVFTRQIPIQFIRQLLQPAA